MKLPLLSVPALPQVFRHVKRNLTRLIILMISSQCLVARGDDNAVPAQSSTHTAPRIEIIATPAEAPADAARFTTDSQWEIAGYNSEEIIYIITISSQDPRILRCRTQMQGFYLENGKQVSITDQQTSTVFPDQQVRVGNWTGLDQSAGANFTVKCRAM